MHKTCALFRKTTAMGMGLVGSIGEDKIVELGSSLAL